MIVPEIITGSRAPRASNNSSIANSAAFAFSVSKIVSTMIDVGAAVDEAFGRFAIGRAQARRSSCCGSRDR